MPSFLLDTMISSNSNCTIYNVSDFIGKRWTLVIILELFKDKDSKKRYNELKRSIPEITPKILSLRLKELEAEGIIIKEISSEETPIKTFYSLTKSGLEFIKIIDSMKEWGITWGRGGEKCPYKHCKNCSGSTWEE